MTHNPIEDDTFELDDDALDLDDSRLWDPMGSRDLGVEGMRDGDKAVMADDPAREMSERGEPGPMHHVDPATEGPVDELFSDVETVPSERIDIEFIDLFE